LREKGGEWWTGKHADQHDAPTPLSPSTANCRRLAGRAPGTPLAGGTVPGDGSLARAGVRTLSNGVCRVRADMAGRARGQTANDGR
jgi:hypothetical protein